jgi:LTXXQ motif family protein
MPQHIPKQLARPSGGLSPSTIVGSAPTMRTIAARGQPVRHLAGVNQPNSTFQGGWWKYHHHHRGYFSSVFVIGFVGPVFWPYAYYDFIDYTFYPHAYDTFWPYAYDDLYDGMYGPYAQDDGYGGGPYPPGRPQGPGVSAGGGATRPAGGRAASEICTGKTAGLTDWPIERISKRVEPNEAQRAALDELKTATGTALKILKAACPTDLPSTPTRRLEAMHKRLEAMSKAVRTVRPALQRFYASLSDEQKTRFNALRSDQNQQQVRLDLSQLCGQRAAGIGNLPTERIETAVLPTEAQRVTLKELQDAMANAGNVLNLDCPTNRPLTAVGRLEAMEQRLNAMLRAVTTVQPALERFYASLSDAQKERFNQLGPAES